MADRSNQEPQRYGERGEKVVRIVEAVQGQEGRGCSPQGGQANPRPVQSESPVARPQTNSDSK